MEKVLCFIAVVLLMIVAVSCRVHRLAFGIIFDCCCRQLSSSTSISFFILRWEL